MLEKQGVLLCLLLWSFFFAHRAFLPLEGSLWIEVPSLTPMIRLREMRATQCFGKTHVISRCQGCKYISHWGLFIFVFQTQASAHGWGDLLNKLPLREFEVNKHQAQINMVWQNCHGNIRWCQQMQTATVALALQIWQWCCCCCYIESFHPWKTSVVVSLKWKPCGVFDVSESIVQMLQHADTF